MDADRVDALPPAEITVVHPIGGAGIQQSYVGHDECAPHACGMQTSTDAVDISRLRSTRGELLDWTMLPAARVSAERPDRLGPG
jgi:hypothetical protein